MDEEVYLKTCSNVYGHLVKQDTNAIGNPFLNMSVLVMALVEDTKLANSLWNLGHLCPLRVASVNERRAS